MDTIICPGCNLRIEPTFTLEQSKKSKQWYRITKCPRERCGFNIDINECERPGRNEHKPAPEPKPIKDNKKPDDEDGKRSFWKYGI